MTLYLARRVITQDPGLGVIDDGAVAVAGGTIAWVGRRMEAPPHDSADVVDLGDATLLPGLIDAHTHLCADGGPRAFERMRAATDAEILETIRRSAAEFLGAGVTTVRDLGSPRYASLQVRDEILSGAIRGPRIVASGPPLTSVKGHCWFWGGEVSGEEEIRAAVRAQHAAGVDAIKIMQTGGFITEGSTPAGSQFGAAEVRLVVEEAHALGLHVAAHAHGPEGIARAARAGVDTLEHCTFTHAGGEQRYVAEVGEAVAAAGCFVSPTVSRDEHEAARAVRARGEVPALAELLALGVPVIASTDSGIDDRPHSRYAEALEAMAFLGMANADVLAAATSRAADAIGAGAVTGRLVAGHDADLVAVGGDPLADLSALRSPLLVVARGMRMSLT